MELKKDAFAGMRLLTAQTKPQGYIGIGADVNTSAEELKELFERVGLETSDIDSKMNCFTVYAEYLIAPSKSEHTFTNLYLVNEDTGEKYSVNLSAKESEEIVGAFREKQFCKSTDELKETIRRLCGEIIQSKSFGLSSPAQISVFDAKIEGRDGSKYLNSRFCLSNENKAEFLMKTHYLERLTDYYEKGYISIQQYEEDSDKISFIRTECNIYPDAEGNAKCGEYVIYQDNFKVGCKTNTFIYEINETELKAMLGAINTFHAIRSMTVTPQEVLKEIAEENKQFNMGRETLFLINGTDLKKVGLSLVGEKLKEVTQDTYTWLDTRDGKGIVDNAYIIACPAAFENEINKLFSEMNFRYSQVSSPLNKEGLTDCDMPYVLKTAYIDYKNLQNVKSAPAYVETYLPLTNDQINDLVLSRVLVLYGENDGKPVFITDQLDTDDWINVYARVDCHGDLKVFAQIDSAFSTQSREYEVPLTKNEKNYIIQLMAQRCERDGYDINNLYKEINKSLKNKTERE